MTPRNVDKEAKDKCTLDIDNQTLKPTANLRILELFPKNHTAQRSSK